MTAVSTIPKGSQISPVQERVYHQSNLIGDWKGSWQKNGRPIEFKVINIRGSTAQVEYTHDGHTERGTASVDGATISFGNVTIGTKNGQVAALEFSSGTAKMTAVLGKQAAPTDQNKLVGSWSGFSSGNGQSAFFQVVSVDGRDAQVRFSANGGAIQSGDAIVSGNAVMFGATAQFTSNDGQTGNVIFKVGHSTYSVPVTKSKTTSTSSSSVNKLA
ncbi:MAG TPA: hypothetical protein VKR55_07160 [Bradyrhizobium sp.]|uniref:hypothetical protein n=1 Tax=Bradyrhizobium sp. TaxID=376 RepID=UPI002BAF0C9D|nr:hypothetical protein [Bradyrhizobium sp.]HLZ01917.1 hypothetical protein [Bradyrhizobium sp.]